MSEKELAEKVKELENRRSQLRKRYEELSSKLRSSHDDIESYKIKADMLNVSTALSGIEEELRKLESRLRAFQSSPYGKKHESIILSGCLTLERHVNELRATLLEGKPPESAGIAGRALALPPQEADHAKRMIDELAREVSKLKEKFGHGLTNETPSLLLTYMWASILLGKMEGVVEALKPAVLEKRYGEMPSQYKDFLDEQLPEIERRIVELHKRYTTSKMYEKEG